MQVGVAKLISLSLAFGLALLKPEMRYALNDRFEFI